MDASLWPLTHPSFCLFYFQHSLGSSHSSTLVSASKLPFRTQVTRGFLTAIWWPLVHLHSPWPFRSIWPYWRPLSFFVAFGVNPFGFFLLLLRRCLISLLCWAPLLALFSHASCSHFFNCNCKVDDTWMCVPNPDSSIQSSDLSNCSLSKDAQAFFLLHLPIPFLLLKIYCG